MTGRKYPPQVVLQNIPPGHTTYFVQNALYKMIQEGHSKGLVNPVRIIVRNTHAFLHFNNVEDAVAARKHLNNYKFNYAILYARLLVDDDMVDMGQQFMKTDNNVPADNDFPPPPLVRKKTITSKTTSPSQYNILSAIMKGLEGCDEFMEEKKPIKVPEPVSEHSK